VLASDTALWSVPFNIATSGDFDPFGINLVAQDGRVILQYNSPPLQHLTSTTDFVIGFDITALAPGSGNFRTSGADLFSVDGNDLFVTTADTLDFTVLNPNAVPEPGTAYLFAAALLLLAAAASPRGRTLA
jgi:hypothetical protein